MKKIVSLFVAGALLVPGMASAADSATSALSISKAAAVQPVRAGATKGKTAAAGGGLLAVLAVVAMGGGIFLLADNDSDKPDSN